MARDTVRTDRVLTINLTEALRDSIVQELAADCDKITLYVIGSQGGEIDTIHRHSASLVHPDVASDWDIEEGDLPAFILTDDEQADDNDE